MAWHPISTSPMMMRGLLALLQTHETGAGLVLGGEGPGSKRDSNCKKQHKTGCESHQRLFMAVRAGLLLTDKRKARICNTKIQAGLANCSSAQDTDGPVLCICYRIADGANSSQHGPLLLMHCLPSRTIPGQSLGAGDCLQIYITQSGLSRGNHKKSIDEPGHRFQGCREIKRALQLMRVPGIRALERTLREVRP